MDPPITQADDGGGQSELDTGGVEFYAHEQTFDHVADFNTTLDASIVEDGEQGVVENEDNTGLINDLFGGDQGFAGMEFDGHGAYAGAADVDYGHFQFDEFLPVDPNQQYEAVEGLPFVDDPEPGSAPMSVSNGDGEDTSGIQITDALREIGNFLNPEVHQLEIAALLCLAPPMLGHLRERFCPSCAHPGHAKMSDPECPAGRMARYFQQIPTLYQQLPGDEGSRLYNSDHAWVQEGYEFAVKMAGEGKFKDLEIFGCSAGTIAFMGKLLELARPLKDEETLEFYGEPQPVHLNESSDYDPPIYESVLLSEEARTVTRSIPVKPLTRFDPLFGIMQVLAELLPHTRHQIEVTKCFNDPGYRAEKLAGEEQAAAAAKAKKKAKIPIAHKTVKRRDPDDPLAYLDADLPTLGERTTVRCTSCFHFGHAPNATKICPLIKLEDAVKQAETRTRVQWGRMKWDMDKICARFKGILEKHEAHDYTDVNLPALEYAVERYEGLDPKTGRVMRLKKKGARIHLNIVDGNVIEEQSEDQTVAEEESDEEESDDEDEMAKIPADAVFPEIPELSNAPKYNPPIWDPSTGVQERAYYRQMSPLPVIGRRTDTQCDKCLLAGHDTRNHTCPFLVLQLAIIEHSADLFTSQELILTLAASYNWQFSLPPAVRIRREPIIELWALLKKERDEFVTKTGAWAPKPPKRSKRKASTPQPVVAPKKRRQVAKAVAKPKGKQAVVDSDDDAQTAVGGGGGGGGGEDVVVVESTSPAVHPGPNVHGNDTFAPPQGTFGVGPSSQLLYEPGWNTSSNLAYQDWMNLYNTHSFQPTNGMMHELNCQTQEQAYYKNPHHSSLHFGNHNSSQYMQTHPPVYHNTGGQSTHDVYPQQSYGMSTMNPGMPPPTTGHPSHAVHHTQQQNAIANSFSYPSTAHGYSHEIAGMSQASHLPPSVAASSGNFSMPVDSRTGTIMSSTSTMHNRGNGMPLSSSGMSNLRVGTSTVHPPFHGSQMSHPQASLGQGYGSVAQPQQNQFQAHAQQPQNGGRHVYGSQPQLQNLIHDHHQAQNGGGYAHDSVSQPQQNQVHTQQPQSNAGPIPKASVSSSMTEVQPPVPDHVAIDGQKKPSKRVAASSSKSKPAARGKPSAPKIKKPKRPPPPPPPLPGPGVPWGPERKFIWLCYATMPQSVMQQLLPHAEHDEDHSLPGMKFRTADMDEELKTLMKPFVSTFTPK